LISMNTTLLVVLSFDLVGKIDSPPLQPSLVKGSGVGPPCRQKFQAFLSPPGATVGWNRPSVLVPYIERPKKGPPRVLPPSLPQWLMKIGFFFFFPTSVEKANLGPNCRFFSVSPKPSLFSSPAYFLWRFPPPTG